MSNRKERKPLPYTPKGYSAQQESDSPTKASILLQEDHSQYIEQLLSRRDNFCTCLQLYKISFDSDLPQRCLIHNNFITLYCQNQFKLLCVNCIYGSAIHKDHRVIPSKNSTLSISRDNEDNLRVLDEQLDRAKFVDIEMKKNQKLLADEYKAMMKQLQEEFKEMYILLQKKKNDSKNKINDAFSKAIAMNDTAIKEVSWWRDLLAKTKSNLPKPSQQEETEVYKHLVLELFMQQKLDEDKLTYMPSNEEMRHQFLGKAIQLREMIENMLGGGSMPEKSKIKLF